jgi:DNA-binding NtrC family response regulator
MLSTIDGRTTDEHPSDEEVEAYEKAAVNFLIVDDEPGFLEPLSKLLVRHGYEVFAVTSPRQALEIVRNDPGIDIVISDDRLPEMQGMELLREIETISPRTVNILMTGGILDFAEVPVGVSVLKKPFRVKSLIAIIGVALESRLAETRRRLLNASQSFLELTRDVPSGLPSPDSVTWIENAARTRRLAFDDYRKALKQLDEYLE